jgi:hypothetical protein
MNAKSLLLGPVAAILLGIPAAQARTADGDATGLLETTGIKGGASIAWGTTSALPRDRNYGC